MGVLALNPDEDQLADQTAELAAALEDADYAEVKLVTPDGEPIVIPLPIYELLRNVVGELRRGNGVVIVPVNKLLTSNQAAEILNVSRPFLVKLLIEKGIPFEYVGSHRRIRLADLLAYRQERELKREEALTNMVRKNEEAQLPY